MEDTSAADKLVNAGKALKKENKHLRRYRQLRVLLPSGLLLALTLSVMLGPVTIDRVTVWKIMMSRLPFAVHAVEVDWTIIAKKVR